MVKIDFKLPPKFAHNFEDAKKEELRCREIHREFTTNANLRHLLTLSEDARVTIGDNIDAKKPISEDVWDLIVENWGAILAYYALMDNPKSPFQIFKADYSEKSMCASLTINLSNEVVSLIDYIKPTRHNPAIMPLHRDVIHNTLLRVRCAYNSIVSPYEWQNILDLQLQIYQNRLIALSSDTDIDADKQAKVRLDKSELRKEIKEANIELRDLVAKYFGEESPIGEHIEQATRVMTVFEEFVVKSKNIFANNGQDKEW